MRLALLVAGTTLPLILFAAGIVFNNYEQDRRDATQRVLETVRSIRLVLDSEMQRMTGALQVLSLTNALRDRDFESFRRISQGFLDQYGEGGVVLVADREGRQVFSSVTTDTASLPPRNNRAIVDKVFAEKKPAYSNLFTGAVKKRLIVTVDVPVIRDGEVIYDISFSPPIEIFQAIIEQQRPGRDWTISIFDGEGINFARVPNPQETIGKRASPSLLCGDVPAARSDVYDRVARRRAADHERRPLLADRLDRGRRHRGKLAGRPAVAQSRHHQRDRRRPAADRTCLCGADGDHDRPRRDAARSPDRGAQPSRQEYAGDPAVDRRRKPSAAPAGPSAKNSKAGSARWRRRTIC